MQLNIINEDKYQLGLNEHFELICSLVDEEIGELPGPVNLVFCDDDSIQQLNRDYRQKDKVTDVLTFTYYEEDSEAEELLGEVIISIPQTRRQAEMAEESDWSFEMEMYKLCIHGLLHLRGYDHEKDEDYRVMKLLEDKIMESFKTRAKI